MDAPENYKENMSLPGSDDSSDDEQMPSPDRRASVQRRGTDGIKSISDVMDRSELIEMASHVRQYLGCGRWNIDPTLRRQANTALCWLTDRGTAALIMRLGARAVLARGWPEVMEDMMARLESFDLEHAEMDIPGQAPPMQINNKPQWAEVSSHANALLRHQRKVGLSSFMEPSPDPVPSKASFLPSPSMRHHKGSWETGNGVFF